MTWPEQVAPCGRKASSTRKIKPQTSNLISVAGRGGGSNTTHALHSPDPETLPIGKDVPPSHRRVPGNQGAPRPTDSGSLCSVSGRSKPPSEPEITPRHYPLGVGS